MKKEKKYSYFVQEKVFMMHTEVLRYFDYLGDEEKYFDMLDVIEQCKVVVPKYVYKIVREFARQFLEIHIYGVSVSEMENSYFDFGKLSVIKEKGCGSETISESEKLRMIYEEIAKEYIRPVFYM